MDRDLKEEVWSHFEQTQNIFLATLDGNGPKVRPVTMIYYNDRFWVTTGADNAKVKQIKENPNTEFCLMLEGDKYKGYIRGGGIALIIEDIETKKMIAEGIPFFKEYWKSADDPSFALLEIVIKEIEYLKPGELKVERYSV